MEIRTPDGLTDRQVLQLVNLIEDVTRHEMNRRLVEFADQVNAALATVERNTHADLKGLCKQINDALRATGDQIRSDIDVAMGDAVASVPRYVMFQPASAEPPPARDKRIEHDDQGRIVRIIET